MSGLEESGIPGQNFLREALTSCTDPLKAIEEFQVSIIIKLVKLPTLKINRYVLEEKKLKKLI